MYEWKVVDPYLNSWVLMGQAFDATYKTAEIELGRHDATLSQFHMLMLLDSSRVPLTPGEISEFVSRERHSISALLSRMQMSGYVRKVRSKKDQRVVNVRITPKGKELLEKMKPVGLGHARSQLEACFTEEELRGFDIYMKRLRDSALKSLGRKSEPAPKIFDTAALAD